MDGKNMPWSTQHLKAYGKEEDAPQQPVQSKLADDQKARGHGG